MTKEKLLKFERDIGDLYEKGMIKSPIHLHGSKDGFQEEWLIQFFKENYNKGDWIFSTHRSHYHWLLSGRDPEELKYKILAGHSMHIYDEKFFTSAIVSGAAPIALGVAKALLMKGSKEKVLCFLGDMAGTGGLVAECIRYAEGWNLPIIYVIEDNGLSVRAATAACWGSRGTTGKVVKYSYERIYPHAGTGTYVMF